MRIRTIFILAISLLYFSGSASVDSLKNLLKKPLTDTIKGNTCIAIAEFYYNNDGQLDSSLTYFEKALSAFKKSKDKSKISQAYAGVGLILREKGIYDKALKNYLAAHKYAVEAKNPKRTSKALVGIGVIHAIQKDDKKAYDYYMQAEKINLEIGNKQGLASIYNNTGLLYSNPENYKKAIYYFGKALKINEEMDDKRGIATASENIGLIYMSYLNDVDEALKCFARSLSLWREMGDRFSVSITLQYTASALNQAKRYQASIDTSLKAMSLAAESKSISAQMTLHDELARAYEGLGKLGDAYVHFKQAMKMRNDISNDEKVREITAMQMQYNFDKERAVDSLNNALQKKEHDFELAKQQEFSYWLIGGLTLMLLLSTFLFLAFRKNNKAKKEISMQKLFIEQRNIEVMDSIKYASRIQNAILPPDEQMKKLLPDHFVLYLPKDIVSGDFYWIEEKGDLLYFAVVDCTGHGVPGAFMSIVGRNGLNDAVNIANLTSAASVLDYLNNYVNETLHQKFEQSKVRDGMDIALCVLNKKTLEVDFAGANNPVWIQKNNTYEIEEVMADKQPIGNFVGMGKEKPFTPKRLRVERGDTIYLFSDGYADQFGGPKGKKMKYKRLKEFIISVCKEKPEVQKNELLQHFQHWKGDLEQIDDVCLIGIKI